MATYRNTPVDLLVDVRSRLEFFFGHLPGAVCIPVHKVASKLPEHPGITRDSRIVLYCASGTRSAQAAEELRRLGYRRVMDAGAMHSARSELT